MDSGAHSQTVPARTLLERAGRPVHDHLTPPVVDLEAPGPDEGGDGRQAAGGGLRELATRLRGLGRIAESYARLPPVVGGVRRELEGHVAISRSAGPPGKGDEVLPLVQFGRPLAAAARSHHAGRVATGGRKRRGLWRRLVGTTHGRGAGRRNRGRRGGR